MKNRAFALAAIIAGLLPACAANSQGNAAPTPAARITNAAVVMAKRIPTASPPAHTAKHIVASPAPHKTIKPLPAAARPESKPLAKPSAQVVHKTPAPTIAPPAISFTTGQAGVGKTAYGQSCAACHGANLQGGGAPALAGSNAQLLGRLHTSGAFFASMSTKMPLTKPGTLTHEQYLDIMAFILERNGYRASSTTLTFASAEHSKAPLPASP